MADRLDQIRKQREKRDTSLSSASTKTTDRLAESRKKRDSVGFENAYKSGYEALNSAYSGWQTPEQMTALRKTIDDSAKVMGNFVRSYGGDDYTKAYDSFNDALSGWDNTSKLYSQYVNADAFNKARKQEEYKQKYAGYSYEDVQKALAGATDVDEQRYLRKYTDYSTDEDFAKALEAIPQRDGIVNLHRKDLERAREQRNMFSKFDDYKGLMSNSDFAEMSQYVQGASNIADRVADTYNDDLDYIEAGKMMTDEQKSVLNYIARTQGDTAAREYLKAMEMQVTHDMSKQAQQAWADWTNQNALTGAIGTAGNFLMGMGKPMALVEELVGGKDYNPYKGFSNALLVKNASQSALSQSVNDVNPVLGLGYDALTSGVESRLGQRYAGALYNVVMGAESYAQTYADTLEQGGSKDDAWKKALIAGAVETLTEQVGMNWVFGEEGKTALTTILKQALGEGMEEVAGNFSNVILQQALLHQNDFGDSVQQYIQSGYSPAEAQKLAAKDFAVDTARAFAVAGLSAGMEGGIHEMGVSSRGRRLDTEGFSSLMSNSDNEVYNELLSKYDNEFGKATDWEKGKAFDNAYANSDDFSRVMLQSTLKEKPVYKTGEASDVDVQSVSKEGKDTIITDANGNKINAKDVTLSENDAYVVKRASELEQPLADLYMENRNENVTAYDANFQLAKAYAESGIPMTMLENKIDTNVMPLSKAIQVYNTTRNLMHSEAVAVQQRNEAIAKTFNGKYKAGRFDVSSVNMDDISPSEKRFVQFLNVFSKMGMDIKVIKDSNADNGYYDTNTGDMIINLAASYGKGEHGSVQYAVSTFAHETTHMMKHILGKEFDVYQSMVKDYMGSRWDNRVAEQIAIAKKNGHDITVDVAGEEVVARFSEDMLNDMTVADKLFAGAEESKVRQLINAVKKWIAQIRADLKKLMANYNSTAPEAQMLREMDGAFEKFQEQWSQMLERTIKVNQQLKAEGERIASMDENNIVTDNTVVLSEKTYNNGGKEFITKYLDKLVSRGELTEKDKEDILDGLERAYKISSEMSLNPNYIDYQKWQETDALKDIDLKPITMKISNGDYKYNLDAATVCKKRKALDKVLNSLIKSGMFDDYVPSGECLTEIIAKIKENGFEVACALCFVDAKRYRVGQWASNYLQGFEDDKGKHNYGYNELVQKLAKMEGVEYKYFDFLKTNLTNLKDKGKTIDQIELSDKGKKFLNDIIKNSPKDSNNAIKAKTFLENPALRKIVAPNEIISSAGLDAMRVENPALFALVKASSGSATPKLSLSEVPFTNEVIKDFAKADPKKIEAFREELRKIGGYRIQSFSDYMANMFFDYVQIMSNFAALRIPAHAYIKEENLVKLFGLTGMKINMSIVPRAMTAELYEKYKDYHLLTKANWKAKKYDGIREEYAYYKNHAGMAPATKEDYDFLDTEDGSYWKYIEDDESFGFDKAVALENKEGYDKNCGIIYVGVSDKHIRALLRDDRVPQVIPYHKSNINSLIAHLRGIASFNDYTDYQNERKNGSKFKGKLNFNFYDALAEAEKEWTPDSEYNIPQMAGRKYVEYCESIGIEPKFSQFAYDENGNFEPNYYKLLADFRLVDSKGNYAPQQAVTMTFPENLSDIANFTVKEAQGKSDEFTKKQTELLDSIKGTVEKYKEKEGVRKSEKIADDVGYHAGDLGKSESLGEQTGRSTGHFGSGTYFVGNEEAINIGDYAKRPHEKVDFSKYNLWKPSYETEGKDVHDFLAGVNNYINVSLDDYQSKREWENDFEKLEDIIYEDTYDFDEALALLKKLVGEQRTYDAIGRALDSKYYGYDGKWFLNETDEEVPASDVYSKVDMNDVVRQFRGWVNQRQYTDLAENYGEWRRMGFFNASLAFNKSKEELLKIFEDVQREVQEFKGDKYRADSASTRFMKKLGYEGVDVRRFKNLDNTRYGSVIYDLKDEDLARKQEIGTARWSEKVQTDIDDVLKTSKHLAKENDLLKKDIERLRKRLKLDKTVTSGTVVNERKLETAARAILKQYNSTLPVEELKAIMKDAYEYTLKYLNTTSDDFDWDKYMGKLYDAATQLVEKSKPNKYVDNYWKGIWNEMRSARIRLTEEQKAEAKNLYGDDWRKEFLGRIVFVNDGTDLDTWWQKWSKANPEVFEKLSSKEQVAALLNVYNEAKENSVVYESLNTAENIREAAYNLYDKFWQVPAEVTSADKHANEIKELRYQHRKAMDELRADRDSKLEELRQQKNEIIKMIRERRDRDFKAYKEHVKDKALERQDYVKRQAIIKKITDVSTTMMDWMQKNTAKEHIPDALKPAVMGLINSIDYSSKQLLGINAKKNAFIPTNRDISIRKAIDDLNDIVRGATTEEGLNELEGYIDFPPEYSETLNDMRKTLNDIAFKTGVDNAYMLQAMSLDALENLYSIVKTMKKVVQNLNRTIASANAHRIDEEAKKDMAYHDSLGVRDKNGFAKKFFEWTNALPIYAFEHMGEGASVMFDQILDGWEKMAFNQQTITSFAQSTFTGKEANEWSENVHTFEIEVIPTADEVERGGTVHNETIKMTEAQMMSLYCLGNRQHAIGHFKGDGIRVATFKEGNKDVVQTKNVRLSKEAYETIVGELSERQIEVAKKLQEFMNTTCSDWGNEVSMRRYGIKGFTEKDYFPIKVDTNALTKEVRDQEKSIYALLNMSFTKPLSPHAKLTMVIDDIFSVFSIHTSEMAKYNALALPVLDMIKYYNYSEKDENGKKNGIKQSLERAFGEGNAKSYIVHFLNDLSSDKESGRNEGLLKKFTRGYKTAAVAANLQVAMLQPISIMRTLAVMNPKYFTQGIMAPWKIKHGMNMAQTYSGIAVYKSSALFDTNLSRGLDAKIRQTGKWYDKAIEASMALAGKMDDITWGTIWNMCEKETADKTGLTGEELYNATAKRFREVVVKTQVTDSTVTRTDLMRSPSLAVQWTTSFMGEPSVSMNVLQNAVINFNNDARRYGKGEALKRNGKSIARATFVYALGAFSEGVTRSLFAKYRDKDDDKDLLELMWAEFLDNLNPMSNLPIMRDIVSKLKGYDVERMDMMTIDDFIKAGKDIYDVINGDDLTYKTVYRTLKALSEASGIPASGLLREAIDAWNFTIGNLYDLKIK